MYEFAFGPYRLALDYLRTVMFDVNSRATPGCRVQEPALSFVQLFASLREEAAKSALNLLTCDIATTTCQHRVAGPPWAMRLFEAVITLTVSGADPFGSSWFYYNHSSCLEGPQEAFDFFLVCGNRVVAEKVTIFVHFGEPQPAFLSRVEDSGGLWSGDEAVWLASVAAWYEHFYAKTHAGRIMMLRDDEPAIFSPRAPQKAHLPETGTEETSDRQTQNLSLATLSNQVNQLRLLGLVTVGAVFAIFLRGC